MKDSLKPIFQQNGYSYTFYVSANVDSDYITSTSACFGSIPNAREMYNEIEAYLLGQGINNYIPMTYTSASKTGYGLMYAGNPTYLAWALTSDDAVAFKLNFDGEYNLKQL